MRHDPSCPDALDRSLIESGGVPPPRRQAEVGQEVGKRWTNKSCRRKWPRNDKDGTKIGQDGAKMWPEWAQDGATMVQDGAEVGQDGTKMAPRLAKMEPRWDKMGQD